jgi:hypothetical protein
VTFDKQFKTWDNLKESIHPLSDRHNPSDLKQAIDRVFEDDFTVGIFYQRED